MGSDVSISNTLAALDFDILGKFHKAIGPLKVNCLFTTSVRRAAAPLHTIYHQRGVDDSGKLCRTNACARQAVIQAHEHTHVLSELTSSHTNAHLLFAQIHD
jgi:hypothetical protein